MSDLISRKYVVSELLKEREHYPPMVAERYSFGVKLPHHFNQAMRGGIRKALRIAETAPAVDAVEVVMCKDCKYFMEFRPEHPNVQGADGDCYIRAVCSENHQFNAVRGCDYCSYGERKDGW